MTIRSTRRAVSLAIACAWLACASPAGAAAAAAPASAPAAQSAASVSAPTQVTVKAGQSLADIAAAATGSHDKIVLGRASRSIFEANPSAFMRGDPSLLKLGAVLNVPALDATGAVAKTENATAATAASAPNTTPAASAASQVAASGAKASGAQAAKPASPAAPASASPAASAVAPTANMVPHPVPAPAPAHAQPAVPSGASGTHAWSGAIEPAPVAPASAAAQAPASAVGASGEPAASAVAQASTPAAAGASAPAASGTTPAAPVSAAAPVRAPAPVGSAPAVASAAVAASHPKVSSLQQLLALKNRVLMELQRHGIGAPAGQHPVAPNGASGFAVPPASGPVSARAPGQSRAAAAANQRFIGIGDYGVTLARNQIPVVAAIVAAIVAALLVLLIALGVSRRRHKPAAAGSADGSGAGTASAERGTQAEPAAALSAALPDDPIEAEFLAILARTPSSKRALMGLAAHYAERKNVQGFDEIAQRIYRLSGGRGPNWTHVAAIGRQLDPENSLFALEAGATDETALSPDDEDAAPGAAVTDEHAALPPSEAVAPSEAAAPLAHQDELSPPPVSGHGESEAVGGLEPEAHRPQAVGEAEHREMPAQAPEPSPPEPHEPAVAHEAPPAPVEPQAEPTLPPEAIAALDGLDIGLPPRVGPAPETQVEPGEAQGGEQEEALPAEPTSAEQPSHEHSDEAEHADEEPPAAIHTPSAPPAVTGLGAAPVGKLNLSFDLNLPGADAATGEGAQAEAEPQPQFTPEQLARIARNKLDLAAEYIALGDLGGARTLIHEVIESNDTATHDEAHAMLATLAPLS
ncbi:hypothetical protein C0Z18_24685 [Trinickia dabaoshanensis]|uniref:Pilus assembly protein FimV n=1 Tax=Trinickia dabaoshanensis TaxID=564714 RepID=A0A2N7VGB0_9BURK|nr:FimV/HubP family polar landmark protein [Trinickia dabaoshanensis]PMS16186.1 hypothetical protein C0Z18_24685 [Trinickia dabaoshanensis]